jgi:hypothetical protein
MRRSDESDARQTWRTCYMSPTGRPAFGCERRYCCNDGSIVPFSEERNWEARFAHETSHGCGNFQVHSTISFCASGISVLYSSCLEACLQTVPAKAIRAPLCELPTSLIAAGRTRSPSGFLVLPARIQQVPIASVRPKLVPGVPHAQPYLEHSVLLHLSGVWTL